MPDSCANHPEHAVVAPCHHCGQLFCGECLTEGTEFYYCNAPECQAVVKRESKLVTCPNCSAVLELSPDERTRQRFLCLNCDRVIGVTGEQDGLPVWEMLDVPDHPEYFDVASGKFIVMTFVTGGIYLIYWFYRQWKAVEQRGVKVIPLGRALLAPFFCDNLFAEIEAKANSHQIKVSWRAARLTTLWWISIIVMIIFDNRHLFQTSRIIIPFWVIVNFGIQGRLILGFLLYLFVPVQNAINELHDKLSPDVPRNNEFSGWNYAAICFGVAIDLLTIYSYIFSRTA